MSDSPVTFAGLLRELRWGAQLTQEQLAEAAGVSLRTVSDLERGAATTPQRETVRLLADALHLIGAVRVRFETVARGRPVATGAAATRTLPRDVTSFTGRRGEFLRLAETAARTGGVVGIHAIGGMAGVGKTTFAVHAAHQLADQFPGGQIFLPLHGHTPGQRPVDPCDALASLLQTIGVPAAAVPAGVEARSALWRDRMAGRRMVLVLDDAVASGQVLPLLPGSSDSLVLVTSRRHLTALDASVISLDVLSPDDAVEMLVRLAGRADLGASDPGARQLVSLCGHLPLAIGMMGRQLHHHRAWSAAGQAAELAAARDRLALMTTENLSVAAAFDLSYDNLAADHQVLFRRLGLHPGDQFDRYAVAALTGSDPTTARRGLEALYEQYLLIEPAPGRYRMHDLISEHARAMAAREDSTEDRNLATGRLLDYYQDTATRANAFLARQIRPTPASTAPDTIPAISDPGQALAWTRAERDNLLTCLDHATRTSQHTQVIALTTALSGMFENDGPWADAIPLHTTAVTAARHLADRAAEARALTDRGTAWNLVSDYLPAIADLREALDIFRTLDDRLGQANTLGALGAVAESQGTHLVAIHDLEEALDIYHDTGNLRGQAATLHRLGTVRRRISDYPDAIRNLDDALGIYRETDDRPGEAEALSDLATVRRLMGDFHAAVRDFQESLHIQREIGNRRGTGIALTELGGVWQQIGDYPATVRNMEEALEIFRELGSPAGEANVLAGLGEVRLHTGDHPAAARDLEDALGIFRRIGARLGEANALLYLSILRLTTGDYPAAVRDVEEALAHYREMDDRGGEVVALNTRGTLYRVGGALDQAENHHRQALELSRAIASQWDEAHALAGLGRCALASGDAARAGSMLREALEIFRRIGAVETTEVAAELEALTIP